MAGDTPHDHTHILNTSMTSRLWHTHSPTAHRDKGQVIFFSCETQICLRWHLKMITVTMKTKWPPGIFTLSNLALLKKSVDTSALWEKQTGRFNKTVNSCWTVNAPAGSSLVHLSAGPGAVISDSVSNGGLIHRVGSLTKMQSSSEHDEHLRRGDNMRSSVNRHHRHPSVKNGLLDHAHKRPSYYKHGRLAVVVTCKISQDKNDNNKNYRHGLNFPGFLHKLLIKCDLILIMFHDQYQWLVLSDSLLHFNTIPLCRRDSRNRYWRNGDMEAYGEQGYYSREEDNDSITSGDRYTDRQTGILTAVMESN